MTKKAKAKKKVDAPVKRRASVNLTTGCSHESGKHLYSCHQVCQWCHRDKDDIELEKRRKAMSKRPRRKSATRSKPPLLHWPDNLQNGRRLPALELHASAGAKLRPLKCATWGLTLNPDFGHLTITPKPRTEATVRKWRDCFSLMGNGNDFIAKLGRSVKVLVRRPICYSSYGEKLIVFSFLLARKPVVPVD